MSKETVIVAGEPHEIRLGQLTLICKSPTMTDQIGYPDRVRLTPEVCINQFHGLTLLHPLTQELVAVVYELKPEDVTLEWAKTQDDGVHHTIGRIELTLQLLRENKKFVWVTPEAGLHPRHQCNLGDVMIRISRLDLKQVL